MTSWTEFLQGVRGAIAEARDELSRLDAAAGDGDLGLTMTAAADGAAALAERGGLDGKTTAEALRALGMELARVAPSTCGTLFARGLLQASRTAAATAGAATGTADADTGRTDTGRTDTADADTGRTDTAGADTGGTAVTSGTDTGGTAGTAGTGTDGTGTARAGAAGTGGTSQASAGGAGGAGTGDAAQAGPGGPAGGGVESSPVAYAAVLVLAAIEGIQKAGKAQPGDRTMLDALAPAAQALQEAAARGDSPKAAAESAAQAAREGAEATKDLEPKVGRASWIAERARGNVDAGAHAIAVIAAAIAAAVA